MVSQSREVRLCIGRVVIRHQRIIVRLSMRSLILEQTLIPRVIAKEAFHHLLPLVHLGMMFMRNY